MSLKDIATEVGVSISTVSRVLNTDNPSAHVPNSSAKYGKSPNSRGIVLIP